MRNVLPGVVVAQHARAAGFSGEALVTALAVAQAESGWNASAVGDTGLVDAKWGPSIGLWQIRSLNAEQGTGKTRDQLALFDPTFNARSAYAISSGGTNWRPWSVFTSGAYKKHLSAARSAVTDPSVAAVTPGASSSPGQPIYGMQMGGPALPITVGGKAVAGSLASALVGGFVDFTVGQVSELQIQFADEGYTLSKQHRLAIGVVLGFLNLRWSTVEFESTQGLGTPNVLLKAHPEGVVFLREVIPSPASNLSATDFLAGYAKLAGLRFVGEPTAQRESIAAGTMEDSLSGIERLERVWEMGERFEKEEGKYFFESAGTLYFASANHLLRQAQKVQIVHNGVGYGPSFGPSFEALSRPRARATKRATDPRNPSNDTRAWATPSAGVFYDINITTRVLMPDAQRLRPAMAAVFSGVAPFFQGLPQMVRQVRWDFGAKEATVTAGTLEQKQGSAPAEPASSATPTGAMPARGTKQSLDFVTYCLRQVGDAYEWGAKGRRDDADPREFDCSGLIEWAAGQAGVTVPHGSANQIAAARRAGLSLTVEQASRIRGALLYTKGHIAVSLGDGKSTVEARGEKYGVVQYVIGSSRFTEGGLIPGLIYPGRP